MISPSCENVSSAFNSELFGLFFVFKADSISYRSQTGLVIVTASIVCALVYSQISTDFGSHEC